MPVTCIQWGNSLKKDDCHKAPRHTLRTSHTGLTPQRWHTPSSVVLGWGIANAHEKLPHTRHHDRVTKITCTTVSFPTPAFNSGAACVEVNATLGVSEETASRTGSEPPWILSHTETLGTCCLQSQNFILNYLLSTQRLKFKTQNGTEKEHKQPQLCTSWSF